MQPLSTRTAHFTDSVIRRMTRISNQYGAVNLSQGFPDFDPPQAILNRLAEVAHEDFHQYSITWGAQNFREALAEKQSRLMGRQIDPNTEIVTTCGSTEAMMAAMMTVANPGDKSLSFRLFMRITVPTPSFPVPSRSMCRCIRPLFNFNVDELEAAFRQHPKALILCNPSNPCGKVFTRAELELIADMAEKYDTYVITDEVYEHIVYVPYTAHLFCHPARHVAAHHLLQLVVQNLLHRNAGRVEQVHGGVCRNVAEDIANVELRPTFVSLVDDTGTGQDVIDKLARHKVNTRYIQRVPDGMGTWLAVFNNEGDVVAAISKRPDTNPLTDLLAEKGDEIFKDCDGIAIELDLEKDTVKQVLYFAQKYHKKVYAAVSNMSIAMERRDFLQQIDCFVCNQQEAGILFSDEYDHMGHRPQCRSCRWPASFPPKAAAFPP